MRITGLTLTGMAVALTGMLAVGVADPAFARKRNQPTPSSDYEYYPNTSGPSGPEFERSDLPQQRPEN